MFFFKFYFQLVGLHSIGDAQECNFFRYDGIGMVSHWWDTEMENLLQTLPYLECSRTFPII